MQYKIFDQVWGVDPLLNQNPNALLKLLAPLKHLWFRKEDDLETIHFYHDKIDFPTMMTIAPTIELSRRGAFMNGFYADLFPITGADQEVSIQSIVGCHHLKNSRIMFVEWRGKNYILKRFISHWEMMSRITAKFTRDGFFAKIIFDLSEEETKRLEAEIDEHTSIEDTLKEMQELGPDAYMQKYGLQRGIKDDI